MGSLTAALFSIHTAVKMMKAQTVEMHRIRQVKLSYHGKVIKEFYGDSSVKVMGELANYVDALYLGFLVVMGDFTISPITTYFVGEIG